ncbi:unnamed protein product [Caenorhabditis angaria]|uniref:U6 small nuclear RNA (adenine-(43)-N(6))-methyltransferase n=1 Tax=Caenorhabditis angaria TaxID=860376 RepID=A0A9P1IK40_9PELO|nr:unnamed protein product [Caenorhabditis angaria]
MSLNKDMHPRNPYKEKPPDFQALAIEFPEFRKYCRIGKNGKVNVDFQEDAAVRCLTKVLLKKDFGLNVELPDGSLVPRIPQKLNYCLIIEDFLNINNLCAENEKIIGIDIGTGASCVYSLLGAKYFGWKFVATEGDVMSAEVAHRNVSNNYLNEKILIAEVDPNAKTILMDMINKLGNDQNFTFCMCNPPFFETKETEERFTYEPSLDGEKYSNRVIFEERSQPHSITFASSAELQVEGGEINFVNRIIDDSIILRDRIKIYTSMLGRKQSIKPLKQRLEILGNDVKYYVTTLNQGKTQRWILAWTFVPEIVLTYMDRPANLICLKPGLIRIEEKMKELQSIVRRENNNILIFECRRITWKHRRAQKRAEAKLNLPNAKRSKLSSIEASSQTYLGTGDGKDSLSDSGNFVDVRRYSTSSAKFSDCEVQAYFPCSNYSNPNLRFRVSSSSIPGNNLEDLISIELLSGAKHNLNQLLQFLKNSLAS